MNTGALLGHLGKVAARGGPEVDVTAVTRDSREVAPGVLFVAIRGARVDGHDLVASLPAGSAVLLERAVPVPSGVAWAVVPDTRVALALASAAVAGFPSRELPVLGVTGTNGKTTVTTLVEQALAATGRVVGVIGTVGVRLGGETLAPSLTTPEAPALQRWFRRLADGGGFAVAMEVSSIGLDLHRVDGTTFHTAVFTNLQRDHLDHHGTFEAYAAAKARLFRELLRPAGGLPRALLFADDGTWPRMHPPADRWLYGFDPAADVRVTRFEPGPTGSALTVATPLGTVDVTTPLVGRHNALNVAAALGAGLLLGVDADALAAGLAGAAGAPGRLEPVPNDRGVLVLVDYAHTPDALAAALAAVREGGARSVCVVFGCGGDRDQGKRPEMGRVALSADRVVVTSDNPRSERPEDIVADILAGIGDADVEVELDRAAAIRLALRDAQPGDAVLVAGKGHETYQEVAGQRLPFDDRLQAAAALEGR